MVVVLSTGAAPYRQAEAELNKSLTRQGHKSRTVLLEDLRKDLASASKGTDAFVAVGSQAAAWLAKGLPATAKLGYCMVLDPEEAGLTADPRTCGVAINVPLEAQFRLIAEAMGDARSIGLLYRASSEKSTDLLKKVRGALPKGWRLEAAAVDKHESAAAAIEDLLGREIDIIWTAPDASVYDGATVRSLLLTAIRKKKPVFGFSEAFVRAGALLGVGIDPADQGRQVAEIVDRVLRGPAGSGPAAPEGSADKDPHHVAPEFRIVLNLIVAAKLGITLPRELLDRAAKVFREEQTD